MRPERGPLSPCVCSTLRMVSRAVTQLYDDSCGPSGLRVTQFSILATIARRGQANLETPRAGARHRYRRRSRAVSTFWSAIGYDRTCAESGRAGQGNAGSRGRGKGPLDVARPLWAQAQDRVLRELGPPAWADAQRRLARLLHVAVVKRQLHRDRRRKLSDRRS